MGSNFLDEIDFGNLFDQDFPSIWDDALPDTDPFFSGSTSNAASDLSTELAVPMSDPSTPQSIRLGPIWEEDSTTNIPVSNVPQEDPTEPLPTADKSPINLSDEERDIEKLPFRKRKLTSVVWVHYKRQKIGDKWKAICNHCKKQLGGETKNGTKHLHDHLKRCVFRHRDNTRQATLNFKKDAVSGKVTMGTYSFDPDKCRNSLAKMVILHEYSLSMIDHIGFREFLHDLQPLFKVPSRNTLKSDILKIYEYEKTKNMIALEKIESRISITADMWTSSNQKKGFMVITAHFIDDAWKLQSRIMRFIYVPCPHTVDVLSKTLLCSLQDWNIDRKLLTLTLDNCTTNDAMINIVLNQLCTSSLVLNGEFFHMRCCAHILNLIVKDGLDIIGGSVEKIRDSAAYWTATPERSEKFELLARQLKIDCEKKLVLDCKTRWNSTYLMLHTALIYKDVFPRLKQRESQYECLPSDGDWDLAKQICEKLKVFFEVTELFSGTKYPTANLFFANICDIKLSLYEWLKSPNGVVQKMVTNMIKKFNEYWSDIPGILVLATVLDPRYKMMLVEYYYSRIFNHDVAVATSEIEKIYQVFGKLVHDYKKKNDLSGHVAQSSVFSCQTETSSANDNSNRMAGFYRFVSNVGAPSNLKTELDTFLDEPILPRSDDFDILTWWKVNATKYPTLSQIAKDILAIPVSTVASEFAFSTSGRFVSPHRNRLHPKTLEALMCAQDWLWADIHANSTSSAYFGCCSKMNDEDVDDEDPFCVISNSVDE